MVATKQKQRRILAIHGAETTRIITPGMFCSIILQPDHLSKIYVTFFLTKWPGILKMWNIWKAPSGGRAEIENIKKC